jgi:hypothetical protein
MNHTIKGILIVAAIASMLVVGASIIPLAQNTYASSHRHQDNILNQGDDTYRSSGSESSNVAVQESGKGNSATAFSDQSSNLQQQQNQPTSSQQQDPQANKDKDKQFPITLNVLPNQRIINTNVNPNTNTAGSISSSASDASNSNTIDNTALARQRQAEASCAIAVSCPEGSTTVTPPPPPATGTLLISKVCSDVSCPGATFPITVAGNNPQPSSFTLIQGQTQPVTLGSGSFTIHEDSPESVPTFTGDCKQTEPGSPDATGTISAGQTLHCTIDNTTLG